MALLLAWLLLGSTLIVFNQKAVLAQAGLSIGIGDIGLVEALAVGDPVDRIQCLAGYTPTLYAENLKDPHGLAFGPDGLYVSEESAGRVSRVGANGSLTTIMTGLTGPEGLAFDNQGNLYLVEDIEGGRLIKRTGAGLTMTLFSGLENPEGITWVAGGSPGGVLYVTESTIQAAVTISSIDPSDYRTHVTVISATGVATRILTRTAVVTPSDSPIPTSVDGLFWSYTGDIVKGPDGLVYFSNELSGQEITGTYYLGGVFPISYRFESTESIFTVDPAAGAPVTETPFADGLTAPEGISFSADGDFPLYVAEENIGGGQGRLSRLDAAGNRTIVCTGFKTIEDVLVAQDNAIYVSEDSTNSIIRIQTKSDPVTPPDKLIWLPLVLRRTI